MDKTIQLTINEFPEIPYSLQDPTNSTACRNSLPVNLSDLFHYYYLDSWDCAPPNPDPAHFEQLKYLTNTRDFRFRKEGMGASRTFRTNKSNELGHAFRRWFLSEHLGVPYIAHLDFVLNQSENDLLGGISVGKNPSVKGDAPDYVCVDLAGVVTLAEAKGSSQTASFKSKKFDGWRRQFKRVVLKDRHGIPMVVKGQIIATRWAFEGQRASTKIFAEDPTTIGEKPFEDRGRKLNLAVKSIHYASSLQKLGHGLMASAFVDGFQIPKEYDVGCFVWQSHLPSLKGLRFVGGYFG